MRRVEGQGSLRGDSTLLQGFQPQESDALEAYGHLLMPHHPVWTARGCQITQDYKVTLPTQDTR